jgi:hypothetical protein
MVSSIKALNLYLINNSRIKIIIIDAFNTYNFSSNLNKNLLKKNVNNEKF